MKVKMFFAAAAVAAIGVLAPTAAFADSCANVSRAPAPCGTVCNDGPIIQGNWVWLPSLGPIIGETDLPPIWIFLPPGADASQFLQTPGHNGNYTNGQTSSLLGMSAICSGGATARQQSHGIQSGCE